MVFLLLYIVLHSMTTVTDVFSSVYFRSIIFLVLYFVSSLALSDVFAMNGEAVSALALCVLPYGPEEKVEQTLVHMLAGVGCPSLNT